MTQKGEFNNTTNFVLPATPLVPVLLTSVVKAGNIEQQYVAQWGYRGSPGVDDAWIKYQRSNQTWQPQPNLRYQFVMCKDGDVTSFVLMDRYISVFGTRNLRAVLT